MKKILSLLIFLISYVAVFSQTYSQSFLYGEGKIRLRADSVFQLPIDTNGTNNGLRTSVSLPFRIHGYDTGQLRYIIGDKSVRVWNGDYWQQVGGGGNYVEGYGIDITAFVVKVDTTVLFPQIRSTIPTNTDSLFGVQDQSFTTNRTVNGHDTWDMRFDSLYEFRIRGNASNFWRFSPQEKALEMNLNSYNGLTSVGSSLDAGASSSNYQFFTSSTGGNQYLQMAAYPEGSTIDIAGSQNVAGRWIDNKHQVTISATTASATSSYRWLEQWAGSATERFTNIRETWDSTGAKLQVYRKAGADDQSLYKGIWIDTSSNVWFQNYTTGVLTANASGKVLSNAPASPITLTAGVLGADTSILATQYDLTLISGTNIYNSNGALTGIRTLDGNANNLYFTDLGNFQLSVTAGTGNSILADDITTRIIAPDQSGYFAADAGTFLDLKYSANHIKILNDSSSSIKRISYTTNINGSLTANSLITRGYVDSLFGTAGGGYTNLTQFVAQTAHRLFISDVNGDVQELAFGSSGQYLKSNGTTSTPSWDTPAGGGTIAGSIADDQVAVGDGANSIEGTSALRFISSELLLGNNTDAGDYDLQLNKGIYIDDAPNGGYFFSVKYAAGASNALSMFNSAGTVVIGAENGLWLSANGDLLFRPWSVTIMTLSVSSTNVSILQQDATDVALLITGAAASSEDLFQLKNSGGTLISNITETGVAKFEQLLINTVDQDDTEDKVMVWDDATDEVEWRDASTLGGGSGITIGTTTITSGTNTRVLYNNSGVAGEYTISGTGNVAMTTSATLTTPIIADLGFISDVNGNELLVFDNVASAINYLKVINAAVAGTPVLAVDGDDANINLGFQVLGNASYLFLATSTTSTKLNLYEDTDNGSNFITLTVPAAIGGAANITFPEATGTVVLEATSATLTTKTIALGSNTISGSVSDFNTALTGDDFATLANTVTLTNKRITKRTGTTTSSATPTINTDNVDLYTITAQTVDITSMTTNLSGTANEGDELEIWITGTASRAITWGASFSASSVALPTTTSGTSTLRCKFIKSGTWVIKGQY